MSMTVPYAQRAAPLFTLRIPVVRITGDNVVSRFSDFMDAVLLFIRSLRLAVVPCSVVFWPAIKRASRSAKTFVVWTGVVSDFLSCDGVLLFGASCTGAAPVAVTDDKLTLPASMVLLDNRRKALRTSLSFPRLGFNDNWTGSVFFFIDVSDSPMRGAHKSACRFWSLVSSAEVTLSESLLSHKGAIGRFS